MYLIPNKNFLKQMLSLIVEGHQVRLHLELSETIKQVVL